MPPSPSVQFLPTQDARIHFTFSPTSPVSCHGQKALDIRREHLGSVPWEALEPSLGTTALLGEEIIIHDMNSSVSVLLLGSISWVVKTIKQLL